MASYTVLLGLLLVGIACSESLMPGGEREMTQEEIDNDKILQGAVAFAVNEYNTEFVAAKIMRASVQVVAGLKYKAFVEMRPRICVHDPRLKIAPCPPQMNYATKCVFEVLYKSWVPEKYSVLASRCLRSN